MIVNALLRIIVSFLGLILTPINIPALPSGVSDALSWGFGHISNGLAIVAAFTHWQFITALFWAAVTIEGVMLAYKFILWLLKKLPVSVE